MKPIISKNDLDKLRRELYGKDAVLRLFTASPAEGEAQIGGDIKSGWHVWRDRMLRQNPTGTVKLLLDSSAMNAANLRECAVAEIVTAGLTRRYSIELLTETQQLGAGWTLILTPMSDTV